MRPRRAIAALPLIALAPISLLVGCSDDKNDAVSSTQASSESPIGSSGNSVDSSTVDTGSDATDGPTLAEVVQATLANGSARYVMAAEPDAAVDDLVAGLLNGSSAGSGGSDTTSVDSTATSDSTSSSVDGNAAGSDTTTGSSDAATGGCDVQPGDRPEGATDLDQHLHCVVLPDGTQVVVDGRDIYLGSDGAWTVTTVQFDAALAQLDAQQLAAMHDPTAVLEAIAGGGNSGGTGGSDTTSPSSVDNTSDTVSNGSTETSSGGSVAGSSGDTMPGVSDTASSTGGSSDGSGSSVGDVHGTSGPNGLEYEVTLTVAEIGDPFLVALAQRAGAQNVTVHVFADETGRSVQALAYEFPQAATTTGGATGNGTGGSTVTSPGSETTNGSPQNPAGGGNGSTTAAGSTLPDSGSTSVPASTFEDIPTVAVGFTSWSDAIDIQAPSEPETLNLGDLSASLEVDLSPGQG